MSKIPTREEFETWLQSEEPRSRVVSKEHATIIEPIGNGVCDFCCVTLTDPNARVFDANDVVLKADTLLQSSVIGDYISMGEWGACDACASFVDNNDRVGLLNRAIQEYTKMRPHHSRHIVHEAIAKAHSMFWLGRKVQPK